MALQIRRGTNAERTAGVVFAQGELIYVTDTDSLYVGNGSTTGGIRLASSSLSNLGDFLVANTVSNELELQENLNLNNNNIVGSGNISIAGNITATGNINIGDESSDTLTILAQVDSNIVPVSASLYSLGSVSSAWDTVYTDNIIVNNSINVAAINANIVADDESILVNTADKSVTATLTGDVIGNVSGDVSGNVTGNLAGDVIGNVAGNVTGNLLGSVVGAGDTLLVDGVTNRIVGDCYSVIYAANGFSVFNPGTDGFDAIINATLAGDVIGNVSGNVLGSLTGNVFGDVVGSIFSDNSTLLIDGISGTIPGENISGTISATFLGNLEGNVVLTSTLSTSNITTEDSSPLVVDAPTSFTKDVTIGFFATTQINDSVAEFGVPVKFPVYVDVTSRDTNITVPELGMVVVTATSLQFYNGVSWVNLS